MYIQSNPLFLQGIFYFYNMTNIDEIQYGNPTREDYSILRAKHYLDNIVIQFQKSMVAPKNSSEGTRQELTRLVSYSLTQSNMELNRVFDEDLVNYMREVFIANGGDPETVFAVSQAVVDDVMPVITKLKYSFQRPRPYQLARYYKLNLFPYFTYFVNSPSFPAGHTTLAAVIGHVLGNKYPRAWHAVNKLVRDVAESRLYLGVHYPTDNEAAMLLCEMIVSDKEFKKRHGL